MSTVDTFPCPTTKGRKHESTWLSGFCSGGTAHDRCSGVYTHPCGCTVSCRCTVPGHPDDRPHPYQETTVVLPDPFTVPPEPGLDGPEGWRTDPKQAAVAQNGPSSEVENRQPPTEDDDSDWPEQRRPWVDGTGLDPTDLHVAVQVFAQAAGDLHRITDDFTDYDRDGLLAMLAIVRAAVRRAGELDALLVDHLWKHHPRGEQHVPGIGRVFVHRRDVKVKWDERGTAMAVVDARMAERGGETPDPAEVVDWLLEAASVGYYRVTALRPLGIDVEDYRHKEKGSVAVDVPVPK